MRGALCGVGNCRDGRRAACRALLAAVVATVLAGPALASSGCVTTNHGALDLRTTITKVRFFNYGGDFDKGEKLRFVTNPGTLSVTISRNRFGLPPEILRWSGASARDYPIGKAGSYSFQVVLSAIPFQTAVLAVSCVEPPPPMAAPVQPRGMTGAPPPAPLTGAAPPQAPGSPMTLQGAQ